MPTKGTSLGVVGRLSHHLMGASSRIASHILKRKTNKGNVPKGNRPNSGGGSGATSPSPANKLNRKEVAAKRVASKKNLYGKASAASAGTRKDFSAGKDRVAKVLAARKEKEHHEHTVRKFNQGSESVGNVKTKTLGRTKAREHVAAFQEKHGGGSKAYWSKVGKLKEMSHAAKKSLYDYMDELEKSKKKSMRPGGGGRFAKLKSKLSKEKGVKNAGAIAAVIGRKKYGAKKMAGWAAKHRKSLYDYMNELVKAYDEAHPLEKAAGPKAAIPHVSSSTKRLTKRATAKKIVKKKKIKGMIEKSAYDDALKENEWSDDEDMGEKEGMNHSPYEPERARGYYRRDKKSRGIPNRGRDDFNGDE